MYSVLSTPSLWWSRVIWEKFKNFHMFCAVEQYKNNGKKSLRIQDLAIQNLWETHMLGHSLSSGTIESTAHQDQPQTSWLFEGISHFRDGLRMMELHVSQFWLSPHLQHWYNCFPMYGWGDPPKPATGLMRGEGHGFPLWPHVGSWYHFCSIWLWICNFSSRFNPVPISWVCWMPLASLIWPLGTALFKGWVWASQPPNFSSNFSSTHQMKEDDLYFFTPYAWPCAWLCPLSTWTASLPKRMPWPKLRFHLSLDLGESSINPCNMSIFPWGIWGSPSHRCIIHYWEKVGEKSREKPYSFWELETSGPIASHPWWVWPKSFNPIILHALICQRSITVSVLQGCWK